MKAIICTVLPKPISSANIPLRPNDNDNNDNDNSDTNNNYNDTDYNNDNHNVDMMMT